MLLKCLPEEADMEYRIAFTKQVSPLLKSLRNQRGLTQKQLGEKLGISQRMVATIEANPERTRFERILQVLSILDADLIIRDMSTNMARNASTNKESW